MALCLFICSISCWVMGLGMGFFPLKSSAEDLGPEGAGAAGALYALNYSTLQPSKFDFNTSILVLVYVVFGGLGNINGTIIATTVLYILPELLRSLQDYRMLIYAIVLIVVMQITNSAALKQKADKIVKQIFKKGERE